MKKKKKKLKVNPNKYLDFETGHPMQPMEKYRKKKRRRRLLGFGFIYGFLIFKMGVSFCDI